MDKVKKTLAFFDHNDICQVKLEYLEPGGRYLYNVWGYFYNGIDYSVGVAQYEDLEEAYSAYQKECKACDGGIERMYKGKCPYEIEDVFRK